MRGSAPVLIQALILASALAACQPEAQTASPSTSEPVATQTSGYNPDGTGYDPGNTTVDPALKASCTAKGGKIGFGMAGATCVMPQPDAGQACTGAADCGGVCLADTRTCAPWVPLIGCYGIHEAGQPDIYLCND
ncbi:MAG: hypothetical protein CML68_19765 [Rhodobacteraceae bacterium]|nr:hypothetical protein [Paracoccaceae bacterium]